MSKFFGIVVPILPVRDVVKTQEYYRDVLGFNIEWIWEGVFGAVARDGVVIYLSRDENPLRGISHWLWVADADEVYRTYRENGVTIISEPEHKPWGLYEFTIEDNNGHLFRIATDDNLAKGENGED